MLIRHLHAVLYKMQHLVRWSLRHPLEVKWDMSCPCDIWFYIEKQYGYQVLAERQFLAKEICKHVFIGFSFDIPKQHLKKTALFWDQILRSGLVTQIELFCGNSLKDIWREREAEGHFIWNPKCNPDNKNDFKCFFFQDYNCPKSHQIFDNTVYQQ